MGKKKDKNRVRFLSAGSIGLSGSFNDNDESECDAFRKMLIESDNGNVEHPYQDDDYEEDEFTVEDEDDIFVHYDQAEEPVPEPEEESKPVTDVKEEPIVEDKVKPFEDVKEDADEKSDIISLEEKEANELYLQYAASSNIPAVTIQYRRNYMDNDSEVLPVIKFNGICKTPKSFDISRYNISVSGILDKIPVISYEEAMLYINKLFDVFIWTREPDIVYEASTFNNLFSSKEDTHLSDIYYDAEYTYSNQATYKIVTYKDLKYVCIISTDMIDIKDSFISTIAPLIKTGKILAPAKFITSLFDMFTDNSYIFTAPDVCNYPTTEELIEKFPNRGKSRLSKGYAYFVANNDFASVHGPFSPMTLSEFVSSYDMLMKLEDKVSKSLYAVYPEDLDDDDDDDYDLGDAKKLIKEATEALDDDEFDEDADDDQVKSADEIFESITEDDDEEDDDIEIDEVNDLNELPPFTPVRKS